LLPISLTSLVRHAKYSGLGGQLQRAAPIFTRNFRPVHAAFGAPSVTRGESWQNRHQQGALRMRRPRLVNITAALATVGLGALVCKNVAK
jgi:hypothetical protein